MIGMKGDMGGGAAVLGAPRPRAPRLRRSGCSAFVPLTDNMTGGDATRAGDVLTIRNGKTVEVLNTDAEGRLILADGLSLATRGRARRHRRPGHASPAPAWWPSATAPPGSWATTGAGSTRCERRRTARVSRVAAAPARPPALDARQRPRRPPQHHAAGRYGGALTAGVFLAEFVGGGHPVGAPRHRRSVPTPREVDGEIVKGGTGFGIRTLVELVGSFLQAEEGRGLGRRPPPGQVGLDPVEQPVEVPLEPVGVARVGAGHLHDLGHRVLLAPSPRGAGSRRCRAALDVLDEALGVVALAPPCSGCEVVARVDAVAEHVLVDRSTMSRRSRSGTPSEATACIVWSKWRTAFGPMGGSSTMSNIQGCRSRLDGCARRSR